MRTTICDGCGKKLHHMTGARLVAGEITTLAWQDKDLCYPCAEKTSDFISSLGVKE